MRADPRGLRGERPEVAQHAERWHYPPHRTVQGLAGERDRLGRCDGVSPVASRAGVRHGDDQQGSRRPETDAPTPRPRREARPGAAHRMPGAPQRAPGLRGARGLEAVLEKLPECYRAPLRFAYCTGWRLRSEVIGLKWVNVDRAVGVVRLEVNTTKNAEGRTFPFDVLPELQQLVESLYATRNGPHLFHDGGQPIVYRPLLDAWHAACGAAEVRGRLLHDLRRSAVRNLERAGVSRSVAM